MKIGLLPFAREDMAATFSPDGRYRFTLLRRWGDDGKGVVNWIMLNPSVASETEDDPTIRRCIGFSKAWGYDALVVTNLYAWRSTEPRGLLTVEDRAGYGNDLVIRETAKAADLVVCAWGAFLTADRGPEVLAILRSEGITPHALALTRDDHPGHPLYLPGNSYPFPLEP